MKRTVVEVIPKSTRFEPKDEKGGVLYWQERVIRPGFRIHIRERSMTKLYNLAPALGMSEAEGAAFGDSQLKPQTPRDGTGTSPLLETDPRAQRCEQHGKLLYPGELCTECLDEQ